MKKKSLLIVALALLGAGGAFAQEEGGYEAPAASGKKGLFSVGAGLIGVNKSVSKKGEYKEDSSYFDFLAGDDGTGTARKTKEKKGTQNLTDIGGYLFFDATYAEVDVSFSTGKIYYLEFTGAGITPQALDATKLGFSLLGKYPIAVGKSGLTLAPLAGVSYDMILGAKTQYGNKVVDGDKDKSTGILLYDTFNAVTGAPIYKNGTLGDFNDLTIKFGAEARYPISGQLYLDAQWLYGIKLKNAVETAAEKAGSDNYDNAPAASAYKETYFTHGSTFKLAVGYAF